MPPRLRFSAAKILDVALELTRRQGIRAVSARSLAAALGSSTGPVFKQFASMDELGERLFERIVDEFVNAVSERFVDDPLTSVGVGWLHFAAHQPHLYEALFLHPHQWHAKWGPIRRRFADAMATHPRYRELDRAMRFALVGRAAIALHGVGVEVWSGRLVAHDHERLFLELVQPVVDAALVSGWTHDIHTSPKPVSD